MKREDKSFFGKMRAVQGEKRGENVKLYILKAFYRSMSFLTIIKTMTVGHVCFACAKLLYRHKHMSAYIS